MSYFWRPWPCKFLFHKEVWILTPNGKLKLDKLRRRLPKENELYTKLLLWRPLWCRVAVQGIIYDQFQHMRSLFNTSSHEHQVYLAHKPKLSLILLQAWAGRSRCKYDNASTVYGKWTTKLGCYCIIAAHNIRNTISESEQGVSPIKKRSLLFISRFGLLSSPRVTRRKWWKICLSFHVSFDSNISSFYTKVVWYKFFNK